MATNRLIMTYGFPRSGNHLAMELLGRNFYADQDLTSPGGQVGHWTDRATVGPVPFGQLAGHHGPPDWGIQQPAIYVYRDGRAVMASLYNSPYFKNSYKPDTFSEFIRYPLDWKWSPGIPRTGQDLLTVPPNPIQHWMEHLRLWDGAGTMRVRYEHLVKYPGGMLEHIAGRFGLAHNGKWEVPDKLVGHFPSGGALDGWRDMWSEEDTDYFFSIVPRHFYGVYRDD